MNHFWMRYFIKYRENTISVPLDILLCTHKMPYFPLILPLTMACSITFSPHYPIATEFFHSCIVSYILQHSKLWYWEKKGRAGSRVSKILPGCSMPLWSTLLHFWFLAPANEHLRKQQVMAWLDFCHSCWRFKLNSWLTVGLRPAQSYQLWTYGYWTTNGRCFSLSSILSLPFKQNRYINKEKN